MKLGILTSSRADFGIYLPLIKKLFSDSFFYPEIIAFGTHLYDKYGNTINEIVNEGYPVKYKIKTLTEDDSPLEIAKSISKTTLAFSDFWNKQNFDLVFALGDRYEMFAAVTAGSPFNVKFAHIHAGETTLGAIDNAYRHSISLMSEYFFVTTEEYKKRTIELVQKPNNVFNVGALSTDNLNKVELYNIEEFKKAFNIDLSQPTILSTFHPETVDFKKNRTFIKELLLAFNILKAKYQIIITMPNSDTMGLMIRDEIERFANNKEKIILVESFGMKGYLSCMKHCSFLLGNTSSGFVEAAYFPKFVINLGSRQKGRIITPNIKTIPITKENILETVDEIGHLKMPSFKNPYYNDGAANKIIEILKSL